MISVVDIKKKYEFFQNMNKLEIIQRQRENKENKFFLKNGNEYYSLCCDTPVQNRKFASELEHIRKVIKKNIPNILFRDSEDRYIVTEYVGNGNGISFFDIEKNNIPIDEMKYAKKLRTELEKLHNYPIKGEKKDWYYAQYQEFYSHTKRLNQLGLLNKEQSTTIMAFLKQNKEYLKNVKLTYIHGDLTPRNCCANLKNEEIYFIDFDMFQIGDPFIDVQKIIWTRGQSKVFESYVQQYCKDYNEDIYLLYWLKIKLFWLPFAYRNKVNYINSLEQTKELIEMAKKRLKAK